jgi:hypothetical protein
MSSLVDALYTLLLAEKERVVHAQQNFNYKRGREPGTPAHDTLVSTQPGASYEAEAAYA